MFRKNCTLVTVAVATLCATSAVIGVGSAASASGSGGLAAAQQLIAQHEILPTFVAPGPALKGKALGKGKTVLIVPYDMEVPYNVVTVNGIKAANSLLGIKTLLYQDQGEPSQWEAGVLQGITDKVSAIDLIGGLEPSSVEPQIKMAEKAGIPVIDSTGNDPSVKSPSYVTTDVPLNYTLAGELEAAWAISQTNGKADVLIITSSDVDASKYVTAGATKTMANDCSTCTVHTIDVPVTEWGTEETPDVEAALTADPGITYILPNYDSEVPLVDAALTEAKLTSVGVDSFNGDPAPLAQIAANSGLNMDIGQDMVYTGYATADAELRAFGHAKSRVLTLNENIPFVIFDANNVSTTGSNYAGGYGNVLNGYRKLWGLIK
ncbi:MAG: sugar ABC transporter substrate-binding protein [Acidimicrobiales bacterium]